jgi:orotate phosphoribosyltransferase
MSNHILHFKSLSDLNRDVFRLSAHLTRSIDVVVGVPRSGLLAANMFALHFDRPLADVDGFLAGRTLMKDIPDRPRVLVLDDSVGSGQSMREVKSKVASAGFEADWVFGAVYVRPDSAHEVDVYTEVVPTPRVFEWNIMRNDVLARSCVDIDGVLCRDPLDQENDDGECYLDFLSGVPANFQMSQRIGCLVTNRLERYRAETEAWLSRNGIQYDRLVMGHYPNAAARREAGRHGVDKAHVYKDSPYELFIESSRWQAEQIAQISGKSVYCMDDHVMIYPSQFSSNVDVRRGISRVVRAVRKPSLAVKSVWRRLGI